MREGMRYERGGKGKYWILKPGDNENQPLINKVTSSCARTISPGAYCALEYNYYGSAEEDEDPTLNPEDERLFDNARTLEFGDWNVGFSCTLRADLSHLLQYPVIEAHWLTRESRMYSEPLIITASTNRNLLQPTKENKRRRKSQIKQIQEDYGRGKQRDDSSSGEPSNTKSRLGVVSNLMRQKSSSSSSSGKSERSQLVDLVVEEVEQKHFVYVPHATPPTWQVHWSRYSHTYPQEGQEEEVRQGFNPDEPQPHNTEAAHNLDAAVDEEDSKNDHKPLVNEEAQHWKKRDVSAAADRDAPDDKDDSDGPSPQYGSFREERNVWGADHWSIKALGIVEIVEMSRYARTVVAVETRRSQKRIQT
jgi:hypothetical protein